MNTFKELKIITLTEIIGSEIMITTNSFSGKVMFIHVDDGKAYPYTIIDFGDKTISVKETPQEIIKRINNA